VLSAEAAEFDADGVSLSGGEWQRVALARSLIRTDADLFILDEPSSGLDPEAEFRLHETIRQHGQTRTRLLISHRLAALRDADEIAVLAEGTIVERGTHDQLVRHGGRYSQLFQLQAQRYRDPMPHEKAS
jgi:ATP-binding cassette subfamily B protein